MIDWTSLLLLKKPSDAIFITENIVLDNIIQNLPNLRMNYLKSPGTYCIGDFQLKYTTFSKIRE